MITSTYLVLKQNRTKTALDAPKGHDFSTTPEMTTLGTLVGTGKQKYSVYSV
jgi:hypothetical protein